MGKKVYKDRRDMVLICTACRCRWKNCTCLNINKSTFIFVTEEELLRYEQTGLVPNFKEEIMSFEGGPISEPIPLVFPPKYDFKI